MARILIVEDDSAIAEMVEEYLGFEHHSVEISDNGSDGLYLLQTNTFDLAIVDWNLPKLSGVDLCKRYRGEGGKAMVLILTGRGSVTEKTVGLDSGADDYLTKPFHIDELMSRVKALLRRAASYSQDNSLKVGGLTLNLTQHNVSVNGEDVELIPKEFAILEMLVRYPGRVFTTDEIIYRVWKSDEEASIDALRTHIKNLRKKLAKVSDESFVETVHGIGYKFMKPK